jgi:glycosyltransferase involved in cell wall biosynthesis
MRVAGLCEPIPSAMYRLMYPLLELQRHGHEIAPPDQRGGNQQRWLESADVVLVYRTADDRTRNLLRRLREHGVAVVWDNDDDFLTMPKLRHLRRRTGGMSNEAVFRVVARMARLADVVTATSEPIAATYRDAGATRVEVIENHLPHDILRPPATHDGIVIGWIAAVEHAGDVAALHLDDAVARLLDTHPDVRFESVGVDLGITHPHYRHTPKLPFGELPDTMARWDIGIAPLTDTPFNRARSNIKLKEYAASHLPWLASPVGPYAPLGEQQGGRLVPDDAWLPALEALVTDTTARTRLAQAARTWATTQTIATALPRHLAVLTEAIERATTGAPAAL